MLKGKPFELGDVIRAPKMSQNRGGSGIFLGGNISCIRKPQVISGGGGGEEDGVRPPPPPPHPGAPPPRTLPLDPPLQNETCWKLKLSVVFEDD